MNIFVNDAPIQCDEQTTITKLLSQQGIQAINIAVAMNDMVIPKAQWDTTPVKDACNIIIIKAVQGG